MKFNNKNLNYRNAFEYIKSFKITVCMKKSDEYCENGFHCDNCNKFVKVNSVKNNEIEIFMNDIIKLGYSCDICLF